MNYNIVETTMDEIQPLLQQYLLTLNGATDDFWEEHVLNAKIYKITKDSQGIGYFAIYNKDKITQFFLLDEYLYLAQHIFRQILKDNQIKTAYVATCDQLFLSLCLDCHSKVEMQAYFFDGTVEGKVKPPEYGRETIFEVKPEEFELVKEKTGDFFGCLTEFELETKKATLYQLCVNQEVLGYGIIVPNKLQTKYWPVGMIVLENYRCKGVGRSIQMHLADICRESGFIPISGCWYYNHLSKKTIESAGRYSKTRLLNVLFG